MKKVLGLILAVALIFTLISIVPTFAFDEVLNVDWVKATESDGNEIATVCAATVLWDYYDNVPVFELSGVAGAISGGATLFNIVAWYMPDQEMADIGLRVDGGEIVYDGYCTYQQALVDAVAAFGAGWENASMTLRINAYTPILEGSHTIEVIAKFTDESTKGIVTFKYRTDNISSGKTAVEVLNGALSMRSGFWEPSYATDGQAPVFDGANVCPLGWYVADPSSASNARLYVDLEAQYAINNVSLRPMGWMDGCMFPGTWEILASTDGATWEQISSGSGRTGNQTETVSTDVSNVTARYICVHIIEHAGAVIDTNTGYYYSGFGEVDVFGTKIADDDARSIFAPVSNYEKGTVKDNYTGGQEAIGAPSAWTGFTTGDLDYEFSFRTDISFHSIGFPGFWSYPGTPLEIEFICDGTSVLTVNYVTGGDAPIIIDLGTTLPKGTYDVIITITDEEMNGEAYKCYMVLGFATEGVLYDDDYCVFERGNVAIDLYSYDSKGIGFVPFDYVEPHDPVTRDFDAAQGDALSYDQILVNGSEIANGNSAVIAAKKGIDGTDGSIETVTLHGWYGNASQAIDQFGYQINGGRVVYGDFKSATEDAVYGAGGQYASRFTVPVDVSALKNDGNVIWIWAKLANGDEVQLNRFDNRGSDNEKDREVYVIFNAPASQGQGGQEPGVPTADASMVLFVVAAAAIALVLLKKKAF